VKRIISAVIALLFIYLFSSPAIAEQIRIKINKTKIYQGDILKIQTIRKSTSPFHATFLRRKYESFLFDNNQTVLIGIHYQLKPGIYTLSGYFNGSGGYYFPFGYIIEVREKFKPKKYILPKRPPLIQEEINKKHAEFQSIFGKSPVQPFFKGSFVQPIKKIYIPKDGYFGADRCAGRKIRSIHCRYHTGTDFRAAFDEERKKPEKIFAINAGKIVKADFYPNMGNVIVIDHGAGIYSGYLHLSKFLVKEGETVKREQTIAIAGNTGTNSIHLHLFIKMNNGKIIVDPEKFLKTTKR
jgi:murein DD-endopeptidase MepM/ murein hydrolase activator NlpD